MKMTEEHKDKIRKAHLGKKQDAETKKKISESMKGNQNARKKVTLDE